MSTVFWIELQSDQDEYLPDDLYHLYESLEFLDDQCKTHGVKPINDFADYSDLEFNLSDVELDESWLAENAKWISPSGLILTLKALQMALSSNEHGEILEDIAHVVSRCMEAQEKAVLVRLLVVM